MHFGSCWSLVVDKSCNVASHIEQRKPVLKPKSLRSKFVFALGPDDNSNNSYSGACCFVIPPLVEQVLTVQNLSQITSILSLQGFFPTVTVTWNVQKGSPVTS